MEISNLGIQAESQFEVGRRFVHFSLVQKDVGETVMGDLVVWPVLESNSELFRCLCRVTRVSQRAPVNVMRSRSGWHVGHNPRMLLERWDGTARLSKPESPQRNDKSSHPFCPVDCPAREASLGLPACAFSSGQPK